MNKKKLIASDLDGTLLLNGSQAPTSRAMELIHQLYEKGIRFPKINIGNIHYERGRYPLNKKMYLTETDVQDLNYLNEVGNTIFYQDVPGTMTEKIELLDFEKLKRR